MALVGLDLSSGLERLQIFLIGAGFNVRVLLDMAVDKRYMKLSDMTEEDEDRLFHIDTAMPVPNPTIFMLIGSPGAGKTSGHDVAKRAMLDILGESGWGGGEAPAYVSIDLDLLVERMEPFRASSMIHRIISHDPVLSTYMIPQRGRPGAPPPDPKKAVQLNTMKAYIGSSQNLELFDNFDWLMDKVTADAARTPAPELLRAKALMDELAPVRERWRALKGRRLAREAALYMRAMGAIQRAMNRRVNIVYETTLTPPAGSPPCTIGDGLVPPVIKKFDEIFDLAMSMRYGLHLYHVGYSGEDAEVTERLIKLIQQRITGRQEYNTPFRNDPFYRLVPLEGIPELVEKNATAFRCITATPKYAGYVTFKEINPLELPEKPGIPPRNFIFNDEIRKTRGRYAGNAVRGGRSRRRRSKSRRTRRR